MNKASIVAAIGMSALMAGCAGNQDVIYVPVDGSQGGPNPYVSTNYDAGQPPVENTDSNADVAPFVPPPPQDPGMAAEDPRYFPELMKSTRAAMSQQDHGLMSAIRFLNQSTNFRMSFLVGDGEGFTPLKDDPNRYIAFLTGVDGEVLTLFVSSLQPGHYECNGTGFAIGFSFTGEDPLAEKTAWSDVGDGYCSFDISKGPGPDDLEARYNGLITANDHKATYLIDDGYFFSRKPQRSVTRNTTPPPPRPGTGGNNPQRPKGYKGR
ncbi:MAG: hypothetical protein U0414_01600 [Polyangiaceae bacterium]